MRLLFVGRRRRALPNSWQLWLAKVTVMLSSTVLVLFAPHAMRAMRAMPWRGQPQTRAATALGSARRGEERRGEALFKLIRSAAQGDGWTAPACLHSPDSGGRLVFQRAPAFAPWFYSHPKILSSRRDF